MTTALRSRRHSSFSLLMTEKIVSLSQFLCSEKNTIEEKNTSFCIDHLVDQIFMLDRSRGFDLRPEMNQDASTSTERCEASSNFLQMCIRTLNSNSVPSHINVKHQIQYLKANLTYHQDMRSVAGGSEVVWSFDIQYRKL